MGNLTQGKTYVKGSQNSIQPNLASNIDTYKSKTKIATSTNIHSKSRLQSYTPTQSNINLPKRILKEDFYKIHDENYSSSKYIVKKMPFKKVMSIQIGKQKS